MWEDPGPSFVQCLFTREAFFLKDNSAVSKPKQADNALLNSAFQDLLKENSNHYKGSKKPMCFYLVSLPAALNVGESFYCIRLCPRPFMPTCRCFVEPVHSTPWVVLQRRLVVLTAFAPRSPAEVVQQQALLPFSPLQQGTEAFLRCQESLLEEHVICHPGISSTQNVSWPTSSSCPVWTHGDNACVQDKLPGNTVGTAYPLASLTA